MTLIFDFDIMNISFEFYSDHYIDTNDMISYYEF